MPGRVVRPGMAPQSGGEWSVVDLRSQTLVPVGPGGRARTAATTSSLETEPAGSVREGHGGLVDVLDRKIHVMLSICVMLYTRECGLVCTCSFVVCTRAVEQCMHGVDKCMCHAIHTWVWLSVHVWLGYMYTCC